jgi:multicomponent Na+:H+ antiporter subunit A
MWLPPLLLAVAGVGLGLFPGVLDVPVVGPVVTAMQGTAEGIHLQIWHGFNFTLLLSAVTLVAGIGFYLLRKPTHKAELTIGRLEIISPQRLITGAARGVARFSDWFTILFQNGYLRVYLQYIVLFLTVLLGLRYFSESRPEISVSQFSEITVYEGMVSGVILLAILLTIFTSSRLTAIASLSVVGYCICLLFVFYSAPDLAMTQFTIDTLTVVLFVLVLFKLPAFTKISTATVKVRDMMMAVSFGTLISIIALEVLEEPVNKEISQYYAENAYVLAKGKNVVNVILVDFRGLDTMVEITVLTIAAIGVFSLLKLKINPAEKE